MKKFTHFCSILNPIRRSVGLSLTTMSLVINLVCLMQPIAHAQPDMPPTVVETIKVGQSESKPSLQAVGSLKAEHGITVRPEIPGRITEIYFKSGQTIKKGQALVQLNPVIYQAQLDTIKTRLALSQKTVDRYKTLMKTSVISKEEFDKVMATLAQDKAQMAEAKARLEQTKIVAPFSGKVGIRKVSVGDYLQAGQEIVSLQSQDPILVQFSVPETNYTKVKQGLKVSLHSDAFPSETFTGVISATESTIDPTTRALTVQAKVANPNYQLVPGAFVSVKMDLGTTESSLMIPQAAVLYQQGQAYVYKFENQKAVKTDIKLGSKTAGQVMVLSGLELGDEIITAGQHKIFPGAPVMKLGANPQGMMPIKPGSKP